MRPYLGARAEIVAGCPCVIESDAVGQPHGVVFEDDGGTGYFYARDYRIEGSLFVDALHVYTVKEGSEGERPSSLRIIWSNDWRKAALLINDSPLAMFDFERRTGYSLDVFPDPDPKSGWHRAPWSSDLKGHFYQD
ncbi:DUF2251 domain-containing protein [Luteolibacter sp. LG18]|uniref:DUF2251 domain-containing protein n=1 Tax=Luteolibacter sp. LG18 TaxID=2819286 RepID=UPI002B27E15C|nr:hypothetical protein llg_14160 [Luteolibacter sp. LG18]